MLDQTQVQVGPDEITIESLPATPALILLTKTIRIVGGLGRGIKDFPKSKKEFAELGKKIEEHLHLGDMLDGLIDRLDSDELPKMIKGTIDASMVRFREQPKQGPDSFDYWYENRFSKDLPGLFTLLIEIYKFNYGEPVAWFVDFFSAIPEEVSTEDPEVVLEKSSEPGSHQQLPH